MDVEAAASAQSSGLTTVTVTQRAALQHAADASVSAQRHELTATAALKAAITDGRDAVISLGHVIQTACDQDATHGPATRATWAHIQHAPQASAAPLTIVPSSPPPAAPSPETSVTAEVSA